MLLAHSEDIVELKKDISLMWSAIKRAETHKRNAVTGRALPLTSKQKWAIYFRLECEVMTAVKESLDSQFIKYLTIHDGMQTDKWVDIKWLSDEVFCSTGYRVSFATNDIDADDETFIDQRYGDESMAEPVEADTLFPWEKEEELELAC